MIFCSLDFLFTRGYFLDPNELFSLEQFAHVNLFKGCQFPWEALLNLEKYLKAQEFVGITSDLYVGVFLENPSSIQIGKGTIIEPGVFIRGPCLIGENCQIRHGAYLRENVICGNECVIGHGSEIKHSIFMNRSSAAHFNYVGDSIIGNGVNLGAGVKCANVRFDRQEVSIFIQNERKGTGLKKLGAIIGDGAQVGCNCVINPGTILGKNAHCFPSLSIEGFIPANGRVKTRGENILII